jgi:hypothetical protein
VVPEGGTVLEKGDVALVVLRQGQEAEVRKGLS